MDETSDLYATVSEVNQYIRERIKSDEGLANVFLRGEISNFKDHFRGHYYFSIKDEKSKIDAVMFANKNKYLQFKPKDGMKVLVAGNIDVYEAAGSYQVYVDIMEEDGVGNLYVKFEELKKKLSAEGLFDESHKRPIPRFPETVGIVTAPTGAAVKDILSTIERRSPYTKTILFPTLVQGEDAKYTIVKQIEKAQDFDVDVLIIGRGGGAIEDLWAFNEEMVARAIYNSKIPTISAVGHEIDFTIADFVADMRAPTPTGAAEMAVPSMIDVRLNLEHIEARLKTYMKNILESNLSKLMMLDNSKVLNKPMELYALKEQKLDNLLERFSKSFLNYYNSKYANFEHIIDKLSMLSPLNSLKRGYSFTQKDGKLVNSINDVSAGDKIDIHVTDGKIHAIVGDEYIASNLQNKEKRHKKTSETDGQMGLI